MVCFKLMMSFSKTQYVVFHETFSVNLTLLGTSYVLYLNLTSSFIALGKVLTMSNPRFLQINSSVCILGLWKVR